MILLFMKLIDFYYYYGKEFGSVKRKQTITWIDALRGRIIEYFIKFLKKLIEYMKKKSQEKIVN